MIVTPGGLLLFAGLYESWYTENDRSEMTRTAVMCATNVAIFVISRSHDSIADEHAVEVWLRSLLLRYGLLTSDPLFKANPISQVAASP
jgi:hypothetical protein